MSDSSEQFDFDAWAELARRDPKAYFIKRERTILEFISAHPQQQQMLMELQSRIDAMRAMAGSPQQALRELASMLNDHLEALGESISALRRETEQLQEAVHRKNG